MRPNWNFMRGEFSFSTVADQRDYAAADNSITDLRQWDKGSFLLHDPSIGYTDQGELQFMEYGLWRNQYRAQMQARDSSRPQLLTLLPESNNVRFEPAPDKVYTVEGDYWKTIQSLAADSDEPTGLPDHFHLIIVWQALKYWGFYEDAPDVLDMAETNFDNLLLDLELEQLPAFDEDYEGLVI